MEKYETKLYNNFDMKKYFIAYFDILGFENMVKQNNKDKDLILLTSISDCIENSKDIFNLFKQTNSEFEIKRKVFSDNFLFCTENDYNALISYIAALQAAFIPYNVFIRGSLYYGDIVFNNEFVYGRGLISAYKLENEIAIFPRILLDDTFIIGAADLDSIVYGKQISTKEVIFSLQKYFCTDFDNHKFLDYLGVMKDFKEKTTTDSDVYNFRDLLHDHGKNICNNLMSDDIKIVQKYQWCMNYHNKFCEKNGFSEYFINYE